MDLITDGGTLDNAHVHSQLKRALRISDAFIAPRTTADRIELRMLPLLVGEVRLPPLAQVLEHLLFVLHMICLYGE